MAVGSDQPYGGFRFRVTVARREVGCVGVVLPRMLVRAEAQQPGPDYLVLRRGYTGALDLYEWWQHARQPKRSRGRRVSVDLLDDTGRAVTTWRFEGCRPVALEYTPLDAAESAIVFETITLTFDTVEML
jgi:phage tail-like protein